MTDVERKQFEKQRQLQEDRRLFFVALTRAKTGLRLSFPASIEGKTKIMSPFLTELGLLNHVASNTSESELQQEMQREMTKHSRFVEYGDRELEYIENFLKNYKLSASDLNTFLVNPRDFLLGKIFRYPFEQTENSLFGTMYHRTLELFYKKIQESGEVQDFEYLAYVFERQLEREFLTQEEFERLKKRGLE